MCGGHIATVACAVSSFFCCKQTSDIRYQIVLALLDIPNSQINRFIIDLIYLAIKVMCHIVDQSTGVQTKNLTVQFFVVPRLTVIKMAAQRDVQCL